MGGSVSGRATASGCGGSARKHRGRTANQRSNPGSSRCSSRTDTRADSCCSIERTYQPPSGAPSSTFTFGECIRKARLSKGLTQKKLAEVAGVYQHTIVNWEGYDTAPLRHDERLNEACNAVGADMDALRVSFPWRSQLRGVGRGGNGRLRSKTRATRTSLRRWPRTCRRRVGCMLGRR